MSIDHEQTCLNIKLDLFLHRNLCSILLCTSGTTILETTLSTTAINSSSASTQTSTTTIGRKNSQTTTTKPNQNPREETTRASPIKAPKCGLHNPDGLAPAIVKEKSTQEGEWPHTCLMYKIDMGKPEYFGGATLITAGVLVTAAHEVE